VGFLAQATQLQQAIQAGKVAGDRLHDTQTLMFNARLDAVICGVLLLLVAVILLDSFRVWLSILRGTTRLRPSETPFVATQLQAEQV
jgi:carbon starvation protein